MKSKDIIRQNKHILFILYLPLYLYCFNWLEARNTVTFTDIHCFVDDWIPFQELFIIPYVLWFLYVAAIVVFLYFQKDHLEDYYHCVITLLLGMSTCLLIYYLFPNEQNLRPTEFARSNLFTKAVAFIYASDTNTNVLPSIHVYNSIAIHVAFATSHRFRQHRGLKNASFILCTLICLSTMFLKQHSFLDVITAFFLYIIYSTIVYRIVPYIQKNKKCCQHRKTNPIQTQD